MTRSARSAKVFLGKYFSGAIGTNDVGNALVLRRKDNEENVLILVDKGEVAQLNTLLTYGLTYFLVGWDLTGVQGYWTENLHMVVRDASLYFGRRTGNIDCTTISYLLEVPNSEAARELMHFLEEGQKHFI